jgi:hypothetical protein
MFCNLVHSSVQFKHDATQFNTSVGSLFRLLPRNSTRESSLTIRPSQLPEQKRGKPFYCFPALFNEEISEANAEASEGPKNQGMLKTGKGRVRRRGMEAWRSVCGGGGDCLCGWELQLIVMALERCAS